MRRATKVPIKEKQNGDVQFGAYDLLKREQDNN
jgi:hypothetical protein